jgi:hypothetical protein
VTIAKIGWNLKLNLAKLVEIDDTLDNCATKNTNARLLNPDIAKIIFCMGWEVLGKKLIDLTNLF